MSRRLLIFLALIPPALAAAWLAADWWLCLPIDKPAEYVGRRQCARCHEKECDLWKNSDHDKAMEPATADTVLGDFDNVDFIHVAFEDVPKLSDGDFDTLLKNVETPLWAAALYNAGGDLQKKILGRMGNKAAAAAEQAINNFVYVKPCDSAVAQNRIADVIRALETDGKLKIDFAVRSKFFRRGGGFFVTTDNPSGKLETFEVKYVFGVRPLQQYLVAFPDGRVQCLPLAWDSIRKAWFHLYPAERIPAGDVLHWTGPLQNWNYMCAACHSTNLKKNYDLQSNTYRTTWSEIDVSCETCHGPGSRHVELADAMSLFWDRRIGYGLPELNSEDSRVEIETCAPCHARRRIVYPGYEAGGKLLDYCTAELLDGDLYYADGQILEEDYVYGSFIQSKMYEKGVRCTDCHDPHSLRVKHTAAADPWDTLPQNRLCTDCHMGSHPAGEYDTPLHHHHPDSSKPGTLCVECHMPETSYMVADPRRDHSMRVPRPDLTIALGIPNACNNCHNDKSKGETAEWAEEKLQQWYAERKGPEHFAHAIAAGRLEKPHAIQALDATARRKDLPAAVRASAVLLLGRYPNSTGHAASFRGLEDTDPLLRLSAVRSLHYLPADELHRRLAPMLQDPIRAVRVEAARLLTRVPRRLFNERDRNAFDAALKEYMAGQQSVADQPGAHLNMAVAYSNLGKLDKAAEEYRTAIRIDPRFVPAKINLAMLCDRLGRKEEAAGLLRRVIELEPELAEAHYSLGLLLAEKKEQLGQAAGFLATAARLAPENPRIRYNYGLALQQLGRLEQAEQQLAAAYKLAPRNSDYLYALAILYTQQKRWDRATACAEELVRRQPRNGQMRRLLDHAGRAGKTEQ